MNRALVVVTFVAALIAGAACASTAESPHETPVAKTALANAPTVSPSPTASATTASATPTPRRQAPSHTGIASVDAALSAVATGDADRLVTLVHTDTLRCGATAAWAWAGHALPA